jgi:hypothetical protein
MELKIRTYLKRFEMTSSRGRNRSMEKTSTNNSNCNSKEGDDSNSTIILPATHIPSWAVENRLRKSVAELSYWSALAAKTGQSLIVLYLFLAAMAPTATSGNCQAHWS